jgi:predicted metal-binding membrane protein
MGVASLRTAPPERRAQILLIGVLIAVAAAAWVITDRLMEGMDAGPGTDLGALGFYVSAWVVMMAAMMIPSALPMVLVYRLISNRRSAPGRPAPVVATVLFVAGYLISWSAFGLAAYALFQLLAALSIDAFAWNRGGPYVAGGVIVAAAVYQLTPAKNACLTKCRGPLDFVLGHWRDGRLGALRMGATHGAWCVGCCWALMAALLALGVMSVAWMAFVAAIVAIEKLVPWKAFATRGVAAVLVTLGIAVALFPQHVPGLTLPTASTADYRPMHMQP